MTIRLISLILSLSLFCQQAGIVYASGELNLADYLRSMRNAAVQPDIFQPARLRYISYDSRNSDFKLLLDKGDIKLDEFSSSPNSSTPKLNDATRELFNYFLIGLALPNDTFWVNLRPDAPDNIIDPLLEKTDIGKIFLEADLQLKKDTASLTSPQTKEGKEYWGKLYKKAGELFGIENITIPTITRPWIVPNEVIVRESDNSAYIYKATLKVMLEEDYLKKPKTRNPSRKSGIPHDIKQAAGKSEINPNFKIQNSKPYESNDPRLKELNEYSTRLLRELIIPKLTYQVNTAKRYAPLRQVYYSLILAQWVKRKSSQSARAPERQPPENPYIKLIDSGDLNNLTAKEPYDKQTYFKQYQKSFQGGEYNLTEPVYAPAGQSIRRYMSGGLLLEKAADSAIVYLEKDQPTQLIRDYLISPPAQTLSSPINNRQTARELTEALFNPERENERLFIWRHIISPTILNQIIKDIENDPTLNEEYKKIKLHDLILRVLTDSAGLKDDMQKSQRELVSDIIHDAIDPSRTQELEGHIQNYLSRLRIKDENGKEYYRDDAEKIYDIAVALEKSLLKYHDSSLLLPIFTICRRLFGLTVYKETPQEPQTTVYNDGFIAEALVEEYTSPFRVEEYEKSLREIRNKPGNDFPKEFIFKKNVFKKPSIVDLKYTLEHDILYIHNPNNTPEQNNKKDIWIIYGGPQYKNVFYIDWTDGNDAFHRRVPFRRELAQALPRRCAGIPRRLTTPSLTRHT